MSYLASVAASTESKTLSFAVVRATRSSLERDASTRNSLPALLAVAKAAKAYHKLAAGHYDPDRQDEFYRLQADLGEAIERLEAE